MPFKQLVSCCEKWFGGRLILFDWLLFLRINPKCEGLIDSHVHVNSRGLDNYFFSPVIIYTMSYQK